MKQKERDKIECKKINSDTYHPEQKYMCSYPVTQYRFEIEYGNTENEARVKLVKKLKRKGIVK